MIVGGRATIANTAMWYEVVKIVKIWIMVKGFWSSIGLEGNIHDPGQKAWEIWSICSYI